MFPQLHLSFSLGGTAHLTTSSGSIVPHSTTLRADIVDFFLNSVGVTLTEIKNVELKYDQDFFYMFPPINTKLLMHT